MEVLTTTDFDTNNFSLKRDDLKGPVVILIARPTCPHCVHFKPEFEQAANAVSGNVRFAMINTDDQPDFLRLLSQNAKNAGFVVRGVPTVVSYLNGKYWSTYGPGPDQAGASRFRTKDDVIEFASGIGSADITYEDD
jgi:thioredoxin-like negative regulator of GroEL